MAFKSYIPPKIEEYHSDPFDSTKPLIEELHRLAEGLNAPDEEKHEEISSRLIITEATDSWLLSAERPTNPFMFFNDKNDNIDNLVEATEYAAVALEELPISTRLIKNIHYLICKGVEYDKKYRGDIRLSPVWIGKPGESLADATFVPPVDTDLRDALTDLENYINYSDDDPFIKVAVAHYQFEMIHPFIDANGRCGRLLSNLMLFESGTVKYPSILLSHIIMRSYWQYCEMIQQVNETQDIIPWVFYFLDVLKVTLQYTLAIIKESV